MKRLRSRAAVVERNAQGAKQPGCVAGTPRRRPRARRSADPRGDGPAPSQELVCGQRRLGAQRERGPDIADAHAVRCPLRSAIVRATRSTRCCPRALSRPRSPALRSISSTPARPGAACRRSVASVHVRVQRHAARRRAAPPGALAHPAPARAPAPSSSGRGAGCPAGSAGRGRRAGRCGRAAARSGAGGDAPARPRCRRTASRLAGVAAGARVGRGEEHEARGIGRPSAWRVRSPPGLPPAAGAAPPASSGANSESSSRNSTPWWASTASPTQPRRAPPTRPAGVIEWCGARNGRAPQRARSRAPARLSISVHLDRLARRQRRQDRRRAAAPASSCRSRARR